MPHMNFGEDWAMYSRVVAIPCHVKHRNSASSQEAMHGQSVGVVLTKFYINLVNRLGGLHKRIKPCHFLLALGAAMRISKYCDVDLFRVGL